MKNFIKDFRLSLLIISTIGLNASAQVYTSTSSNHRIYYRDGAADPGSYTTHYSLSSSGPAIYASLYGEVDGHRNIYYHYFGTSNPRVAEIIKLSILLETFIHTIMAMHRL